MGWRNDNGRCPRASVTNFHDAPPLRVIGHAMTCPPKTTYRSNSFIRREVLLASHEEAEESFSQVCAVKLILEAG